MQRKSISLFAEFIAERNLKMTPQRRIIIEEFLNDAGHMTTEELYQRVKQKRKSIGQATVYRTMRLMAESGLAREVDFGDGITRWERHHGNKHHDHLICRHCGKNVEVADEKIERLQEEVAAKNGFLLTGHVMYLFGICNVCQEAGIDANLSARISCKN